MPTGSSHRSKWSGNQRVLLATNLLFAVILIIGLTRALILGKPAMEIMAGLFCYLFFTAPFAIALLISRHRSRPRRSHHQPSLHREMMHRGFAEITLSEKEPLPPVCLSCGEATSRNSKIIHKAAKDHANPYDWKRVHPLVMIVLVWKWFFWVLGAKLVERFERWRSHRNSQSADLKFLIPQCRTCRKTQPVMLRNLDFHGRKVTLGACRAFIIALHETRKKAG